MKRELVSSSIKYAVAGIARNPWITTLFTNVVSLVCGILTGVVVARTLQPAGRGELAAVMYWPQLICAIGYLSINEAVIFKYRRSGGEMAVVTSGVIVAVLAAILWIVLSWVVLPFVLGYERHEWYLFGRVYATAFIASHFLAMTLIAVDHADLEFGMVNLYRLIVPVAYLIGLCLLWWWEILDVKTAATANLCGTMFVCVLALCRNVSKLTGKSTGANVRAMLSTACGFHASSILRQTNLQIDKLAVLLMFGNYDIGLYAIAFTYATSGISVVSEAFGNVMFPRLVGAKEQGQTQYVSRGLRYSMLILAVGTIPIVLAASFVVPWLFGDQFKSAVSASEILAIANTPIALRQIVGRNLRALGQIRPGMIAEGIALVGFVFSCYPLGIAFGLNGIAASLLIGAITSLCYVFWYMNRELESRYQDLWGLNIRTAREILEWIKTSRHGA